MSGRDFTPVILHGVVPPECKVTPVILHGVVPQSVKSLWSSYTGLYPQKVGRSRGAPAGDWLASSLPTALQALPEAPRRNPGGGCSASPAPGPGFRAHGAGCRVQGAGFRVQGAGCRVQGAGFRVQGSEFRVHGAGFRVQGAGCRVQGSGCRGQVVSNFGLTSSAGGSGLATGSDLARSPVSPSVGIRARPHANRDVPHATAVSGGSPGDGTRRPSPSRPHGGHWSHLVI